MLENAAEDIEDEVKEKIKNTTAEIPGIEENNNATKQGLDEIEIPDIVPLQELVEGELKYRPRFCCIAQANHF